MTEQDVPAAGIRSRRPASQAEAAALASAVRLRIIRLTYRRALTNKEIADRLGKDPATTLYHVRKLVDTGFLEPQPVRVGTRGSKEIPYRSTGLSWRLRFDPDETIETAMLEAFLGEIADVGMTKLLSSRLVLQLDQAGEQELQRRLDEVLDELAARPPTPGGRRIAMYVATYPSE
ncbi:MAG TPA: winged helix-turn-helix domain-containing protein [Pseudonocardiaceae bacterium]|nr:winged helix-turn-helix domain-containing protein [Pseudonocardiaceae bacterium]